MYWVDRGQVPAITRAELDCANRVAIVTRSIAEPVSITVDMDSHYIYWTDAKIDAIQVKIWKLSFGVSSASVFFFFV